MAINVFKEKIKKRDEQSDESDTLVKKQAEEVKKIHKEITNKLVKELHKKYQKNNVHPKIKSMMKAFTTLVKNKNDFSDKDIEVNYFLIL